MAEQATAAGRALADEAATLIGEMSRFRIDPRAALAGKAAPSLRLVRGRSPSAAIPIARSRGSAAVAAKSDWSSF